MVEALKEGPSWISGSLTDSSLVAGVYFGPSLWVRVCMLRVQFF